MDYAMTAQTGVLLAGRYQMGQLLGSGGFGSVYLATDERLHRPVAIKVCSTQRLPPQEADEAARLFQSEALTLARLRHPGLTAIWDYFNQDDAWYLVMEYVPGETLRSLLRRVGGPLPQAEGLDYTRQLCAVLDYLHRQHPPVVFRDLKPANIMVTPEGQLKLIDFGIARLFSPGKAADTSQFGTPGYAPPEQYGGQTEPRSDLFSLGVVLHQMLTGHNPASTPFVLPPVRSLNPAVPDQIEALITRSTAYAIDERVPTADEFCQALDAAIVRQSPAVTAPAPRIIQSSVPQPITGPTTGRAVWSPTPRALPSRPESSGIGRGITLIVLLMILLGSLGVGGYLLKSQIADFSNHVLKPIVVPATQASDRSPAAAVFSAQDQATGSENLYQINLSSGTTQQLTRFSSGMSASQPAISPDGTRIAYTKADSKTSEVWVMNSDGSNSRRLLPSYPFARSAAWSPDSQWLAVETAEDGREWRDHDIVVVDVKSGKFHPLVESRSWEGGPTWSPDGTRIAYHARIGGGCMELYAINWQGGTPEQLTDLSGEDCRSQSNGDYWPDWSEQGIVFGRKLDGNEYLAILDPKTKAVRVLNTGSEPAGHPRWSKDGRYLLFEQGKDDQVSLARVELATCQTTCDVQPIDTNFPTSRLADWH